MNLHLPRRRKLLVAKALALPAAVLILSGTLLSGSQSRSSDATDNTDNVLAAAATFTKVELANGWTTGLTHTAGSGSGRLLIFVAGRDGPDRDLTSVTYGGQVMTQANNSVICNGGCARNEFWYLDEAGLQAASGDGFAVTPGNFGGLYAAVTLRNVDQITPIGDTSSNGTTTQATVQIASALNVTYGDMMVVGATSGTAGNYTPDAAYTEGADDTAGSRTVTNAYLSITAVGTEQPSTTFNGTISRHTITGTVINHA